MLGCSPEAVNRECSLGSQRTFPPSSLQPASASTTQPQPAPKCVPHLLIWCVRHRHTEEDNPVEVVAGVDLGGTAVNYTIVDQQGKFLIEGLCEHPALAKQGPDICLQQIADGLKIAADKAGVVVSDIVAVGLDTPGPASASGVLSARGSTNFVHAKWAGFDIRESLAHKLGKPVLYLNEIGR